MTLIVESFKDIRYFLLIVLVCIASFASAFLILDKNQKALDNDGELIDIKFKSTVFDSLLNQYLLGLGEFETDPYSDNDYAIYLWIMFILATLITQIILFNTLIAILGDSYARIME